ncbi:MAG TPA: hypothetical protein VFE78_36170 [Gemmataceae bacterium]|nr:hypothetical protein [Gemmataceae bacterium]
MTLQGELHTSVQAALARVNADGLGDAPAAACQAMTSSTLTAGPVRLQRGVWAPGAGAKAIVKKPPGW